MAQPRGKTGGNGRWVNTGGTIYGGINNTVPVANFIGTPVSGSIPLTVTFTNQSTGNISSYLWDFGDGTTSTSTHPSKVYLTAGTRTVTLTATGPGGSNIRTRTNYITATVVTPTLVTLSVSSNNVSTGSSVTITATLNQPADQTYTINLTKTGSANLSSNSISIATGQTTGTTFVSDTIAETTQISVTSVTPTLTISGSPQSITYTTSDVGNLIHDGPATPEQISLWLSVNSNVPQSATATCKYRVQGAGSWTTGHSLYRVHPTESSTPVTGGPVSDGFAWPIIDLQKNTTYEVEVTVNYSGTNYVRTLTHTTRALPPPAGPANKTANSIASIKSQINTLVPGDVLEIAAGTYTLSIDDYIGIANKAGTASQPIYIRGASRTGTIIKKASGSTGIFFYFIGAQYIIIENLTIEGENDFAVQQNAYHCWDGAINRYLTIRNTIATGISRFFYGQSDTQLDGELGPTGCLIYNNTIEGTCQWSTSPTNFLGSSASWGNDGINIGGVASCAFNNTIKGFGDTFACATHADTIHYTSARGVHIYRNEIRNSCDDVFEADYGRRNITFYDNRIHNTINFMSLDPLHGGPYLHTRNIYINLWRKRPFKWNTLGSGFFIYNNTLVMGNNAEGNDWGSYISGGSGTITHKYYGYRNNVFVWQGGTTNKIMFFHESVVNDPIDWDHNSHWPDAEIRIGALSYQPNLAAAQNNWPNTTPIFSGSVKRFQNDTILASSQPFSSTITLGTTATDEVTSTYTPTISSGTAKNSGAIIPNITDGYTGGAPDRGAVISGRNLPTWGDLTVAAPASGTVSNLGTQSLNSGVGRSVHWWNAWSGVAYAPWWGSHGSIITAGGGHTDGDQNDIARLDIGTGEWIRIKNPPATSYVKTAPDPRAGNNADNPNTGWMYANAITGDYTLQVGESPAEHHYGGLLALPEDAIPGQGAVNGWLFKAGQSAIPLNGNAGAGISHKLRMGVDQLYTLHGTPPQTYQHGTAGSAYDSLRKKVWFVNGNSTDPMTYYCYKDLATGGEGTVTMTGGITWVRSYDSIEYSPGYDCLIHVTTWYGGPPSTVDILVIDLATNTAYRPTKIGTPPDPPNSISAACWSETWNSVAYLQGNGENKVWFCKPTGNPRTAAWQWTSQTITGSILPVQGYPTPGGNPGFNRVRHVTSLGNTLIWCADERYPVQLIGVTPP